MGIYAASSDFVHHAVLPGGGGGVSPQGPKTVELKNLRGRKCTSPPGRQAAL
jgi:hypothetical protein